MIIPDANLLIYAYDRNAPDHPAALAWWQGCLSGSELVFLCHPVMFAFLRIITSSRIMASPLAVRDAVNIVESWLGQRSVSVVIPDAHHHQTVLWLLKAVGTAGNLTTDAQIAAIALAHGGTVHTNDADFKRFPGLLWNNPLNGHSGQNL